VKISQVCYHPQLGPIETCDTCMSKTKRATRASVLDNRVGRDGDIHKIREGRCCAARAFGIGFSSNHVLYCTVCDTITKLYYSQHGKIAGHRTSARFRIIQAYEEDHTNPFTATTRNNAFFGGRCVEACQNVQVE